VEDHVKYLVIMQINPDVLERLTPEDWTAIGAGHTSLIEETTASGELVSTEALTDPSQSVVLRKGASGPIVQDGPFAEAKEFMGGFYIFDVESRERALQLAARIPDLNYDGLAIEVRGILAPAGGDA
jgi:hypothetical protein